VQIVILAARYMREGSIDLVALFAFRTWICSLSAPAKWGSGLSLQSGNCRPRMSALGQSRHRRMSA